MDENKSKQTNNDVHIEQVNPRKELNDLEKTVILQFKIDKKIEILLNLSLSLILKSIEFIAPHLTREKRNEEMVIL